MKKLSRRRFLAGAAGVTLALPFLESVSFVPEQGRSGVAHAANGDPIYTMFFKQGNGVQQGIGDEPDRFWPHETGALTPELMSGRDSDRALSELSDYADQLLVVSGLNFPYRGGSCGHARGLAQLLTAATVLVGDNNARAGGESVDHFISRTVAPMTGGPLNLIAGQATGNYVSGGMSYSGSNEPRIAQNNPFAVYQDMFGGGGEELQNAVAVRRRSVNDLVRAEMRELMGNPQLGALDQRRLQDHFDFIRDVEIRMACELPLEELNAMENVRELLTQNDSRVTIAEMMMDLCALSFACGRKRTATIQMGPGNDNTRYMIDGELQNSYHHISHRVASDGADGTAIPDADILHHKIDRLHARLFKHFLDRISQYSAPSGDTLLADTIAVWTNDLSNGPPHSVENVPFIIAGSGGGFLRQGAYVDVGGVTHDRLLNTIISAHGITDGSGAHYTSFGDAAVGLDGGVLDSLIA